MSVRYSLLTLLQEQDRTAKQLQEAFEAEMSGLFTLNIGQVSQTLSRLVRDHLVTTTEVVSPATGRDVDLYHLTEAGRSDLHQWWEEAITQPGHSRDELVIKFALAARREEEDPSRFTQLLDTQRFATLAQIRELTQHATALPEDRSATRLNAERQIFELEGIMRWLDRVEALATPPTTTRDKDI